MSKFGWSYPAGCSGPPDDDAPDPSELEESVLSLLEEAGAPRELNNEIMRLINKWELSKAQPDFPERIPDNPDL